MATKCKAIPPSLAVLFMATVLLMIKLDRNELSNQLHDFMKKQEMGQYPCPCNSTKGVGSERTTQEKMLNKKSDHDTLESYAKQLAIMESIFVITVGSKQGETALNLWESSFVKFNITNYLFITQDLKMHKMLLGYNINSFIINSSRQEHQNHKGSTVEMQSVQKLLHYNLTVIVIDVDIIFFKNPLLHLKFDKCDVMTKHPDDGHIGIYVIRPTERGRELMSRTATKQENNASGNYKNYMMDIIEEMEEKAKLTVTYLDTLKFQYGSKYFNHERTFNSACKECVTVLNDGIQGEKSKIYRLKELLLWSVDEKGYYSSQTNNYLMYTGPELIDRNKDRAALEFAFNLGRLLTRIVILPKFNCQRKSFHRCHVLGRFGPGYVEELDSNIYRESSFFENVKVPHTVKKGLIPKVHINFFGETISVLQQDDSIFVNVPNGTSLQSMPAFISNKLRLRQTHQYKVIHFTSLAFE